MIGQDTSAIDGSKTGANIDVEAWRRRIRADAFGRYHYEMGIAIRVEGNLPVAIQHLRTAIDTDPTLVDAYYQLGRIHESQGQPAEAQALYARARAQDPGFPAATLVRLALKALDRDTEGEDEALALARQALTHDPAQPDAPWVEALILARRDRMGEAATLWMGTGGGGEAAVDLAWRFYRLAVTLREAGRDADAGTVIDRALALDPDLPQALGFSGMLLVEAGQAVEAEARLRRAVEIQPGIAWLHAHLGNALLTLGRPQDAVAELRTAAADMGDDAWVLGQLGSALARTGGFDEAVATLQKSLSRKADVPWVLGHLGLALRGLSRTGEAAAVLERAVRHDPENPWLLALLGETRASESRFGEAVVLYRQALDRDRQSPSRKLDVPWVLGHLGLALRELGRIGEATAELERAVEHAPENPWLLALLGEARASESRFDEAVALYRQALERGRQSPDGKLDVPWVLGHLGLALRGLGRNGEAVAALERAVGYAPGNPWLLALLGEARATDARFDEAASLFRQALDRDPDAGWIMARLGDVLFKAGRLDEAETALAAAARFPDVDVQGMLGLVLLAQHRGDAAAQAFRRALDRHPSMTWLHEGLAAALLMAGRTADAGDAFTAGWAAGMDPVTAFARLWLSLTPTDLIAGMTALAGALPGAGWPLRLLGLARLADGDAGAAVSALTEGAERDPTAGGARVLLGLALTAAGDAAAGLASIDRGLALGAGDSRRTYRGLALQSLNRLEEAEVEHRATLAAVPEDTAGRLHLALTLHALKREDEGRALLRQVSGQFPGRTRVLMRLLPSWAGPMLASLQQE